MLERCAEQRSPGGGQRIQIGDAPGGEGHLRMRCPTTALDATMALEIGGRCGPGRARRSEAVATAPGRSLAQLAVSLQAPVHRRDIDSQLARVINLWPQLPRSIQAAVLAMVEAAREHR
jgi:hypothetical protein